MITRTIRGLYLVVLIAVLCQTNAVYANMQSQTSSGTTVTIKANPDGIVTSGLKLDAASDANSFKIVAGPYDGMRAFETVDHKAILAGKMESTLGEKGSLLLWFHTDQKYQGGVNVRPYKQKLVESDGLFTLYFEQQENCVRIYWEWAGQKGGANNMHILMPVLPGPQWVHLAFAWDTANGYFNCYLNGTPYRIPGMKVAGFHVGSSGDLKIYPGRFAFGQIDVMDRPFDTAKIEELVGKQYFGKLRECLGAVDLGKLDPAYYKGKLIYENSLSTQKDMADWVTEGPAIIDFKDRWMVMSSAKSDPNGDPFLGHIVNWCKEVFPEDFVAEFEVQILSEYGLNIVFFAARGVHGEDAFSPNLNKRNGIFKQYTNGDLNSYHISYYASGPDEARSMANLRKNSGFYLVSNGPVGIPYYDKDTHIVTIVKQGGHIQLAVDGRKAIDYTDDGKQYGPIWGKGAIGLRQMKWSVCRYRNFKVYNLKK